MADREAEAFGVFYDRHAATVLAFLARRTADPHLAAELTAETFAKAFVGRRRYRVMDAPALAWLLGIARHELVTWARRRRVDDRARRRLGMQHVELDDASLERLEQTLDAHALGARLDQALGALSPAVAEAVRLRVVGELPYDELAERLGCTEGAARVRVTRGLNRLAELLEEP